MAKWTAKKLKSGIDSYFAGICRMASVKEQVPTGKKDSHGHEIFELVEMKNGLGEVVMAEEWILPPSIPDLMHCLDISREEWQEIKADEKMDELVRAAEMRVERYLRRELLMRPNKAIKGVVLTLQKDFGFGDGVTNESGDGSLEQLLLCGGGE